MLDKLKILLKPTPLYKIFTLPKMNYVRRFKKLKIDENAILLESQHGKEVSGNIFYLLKELRTNPEYAHYTVYLTCQVDAKEKIKGILDNYNIKNVNLLVFYTKAHIKAMATAKYLFNDNTFLPFFIKKDGQVYLNTWHGTPLKTLGKGIRNAMHSIGNTQKNFVCADYLLYPNEYTMEHMVEDYMLQNIALGECVLGGYPRNTAFFDKARGKEIINKLDLQDKKIYAYMPTWRGTTSNIDNKANIYLQYYLYELDKRLNDDEILYVNLHPIAQKDIDFEIFSHIKNFPEEYETYDFLNCAQCLVTDYSSVFYDFANTGRKIILFTYDEEEYFEDRGVYKPLSELPFPNVKTVDNLLSEMRSFEKNYDDTEFLKEYCSYDSIHATKEILDFTLNKKKSDNLKEFPFKPNGKKNVFIYLGNMDRNGVTTAAMNLLNTIDVTENNYFVSFSAAQATRHQDAIAAIPEGVSYFPVQGAFNLSLVKKLAWLSFTKRGFPLKLLNFMLRNDWQLEIKRTFGGASIDSAIQFTGYATKMILLFSQFPCTNTIYVHSDMLNEIKFRGNQRKSLLKYAYKTYDNVALVTPDIKDSTATFVKNTDNFKIAHNVIAVDEIIKKGNGEIEFEPDVTQCNKTLEQVKEILNGDQKVIISVGRYSPEKAHRRMIDAFSNVWTENKNTHLIIIGGNQRDGIYDELCKYIKTLPCKNNITLILSMNNPMPIVKACDGFILASEYEGFGLVLVEADVLGVPVISTDITGPRVFMNQNGGTLVENSQKGVEEGFKLLIDGKVSLLTADYTEYNRFAVEEFKSLL